MHQRSTLQSAAILVLSLGLAGAGCAPASSAALAAEAQGPDIGSAEQAAMSSTQNVLVVNTASQPVPVTGAVAVAGTASVSVANTPTVNVGNTVAVNVASMPSVSLAPDQTVTATQGTAPWSVSLADNTVNLAPGATVTAQISGTPYVNVQNTVGVTGSVAISGSPTVQVASGSMTVDNPTASPVPVRDTTDSAGTIVNETAIIHVFTGTEGGFANVYTVPAGMRLIVDYYSVFTTDAPTGQDLFFSINGAYPAQSQHVFAPTYIPTAAGTSRYLVSQQLHLLYDAGTTVQVTMNRTVGPGLVLPDMIGFFQISGRLVPNS